MATLSIEKILERGLIQVKGMEKYASDAQHAPVANGTIIDEIEMLQRQKILQDSLKAQLHQATQVANEVAMTLEKNLVRNVNYFQGIWGKKDKRLEEIGGKALKHPQRHRGKVTA